MQFLSAGFMAYSVPIMELGKTCVTDEAVVVFLPKNIYHIFS